MDYGLMAKHLILVAGSLFSIYRSFNRRRRTESLFSLYPYTSPFFRHLVTKLAFVSPTLSGVPKVTTTASRPSSKITFGTEDPETHVGSSKSTSPTK
mmetsp:Transcript_29190/g.58854  ORF Transcript_29190/g.58854 Transcript_29190/m.58854 type:complete len:97 (-) Transcript_29190:557-847(-)